MLKKKIVNSDFNLKLGKIPACLGLTIGHLEIIETIPIGIAVEFDANQGTITMLESSFSVLGPIK